MFTGIIEEIGQIGSLQSTSGGLRILIHAKKVISDLKIGDSVSINGACQTVVKISGYSFEIEVSLETINVTTFKYLKNGDFVNLERAMKLSDRLGGHLVSGHIDGIGVIKEIRKDGFSNLLSFSAPDNVAKYIIYKGSIAIDGISLTISSCKEGGRVFSVAVIPHSQSNTTLNSMSIAQKVNLESDLIAKYVEKFSNSKDTNRSITSDYLSEHGFI